MPIWIVGLLKYLKKRYLSNLQVSAKLSSAHLGDVSGLSADEIASRIEQLLLGGESGSQTSDR